MIDWFRSWSKGIIIAVIISTIIEMILPDNTSKKYIKIVIGIFIVYTIISPVINQFFGDDVNKYLNVDNYIQTSANVVQTNQITTDSNSSIEKIYVQNLQNDIKTKLKGKGYIAENVNIKISDDETYNIEKIEIKISQKSSTNSEKKQTVTIVDNIKSIKVNVETKNNDKADKSVINENDKKEIKQLLKSTYEIDEDKVNIF